MFFFFPGWLLAPAPFFLSLHGRGSLLTKLRTLYDTVGKSARYYLLLGSDERLLFLNYRP